MAKRKIVHSRIHAFELRISRFESVELGSRCEPKPFSSDRSIVGLFPQWSYSNMCSTTSATLHILRPGKMGSDHHLVSANTPGIQSQPEKTQFSVWRRGGHLQIYVSSYRKQLRLAPDVPGHTQKCTGHACRARGSYTFSLLQQILSCHDTRRLGISTNWSTPPAVLDSSSHQVPPTSTRLTGTPPPVL